MGRRGSGWSLLCEGEEGKVNTSFLTESTWNTVARNVLYKHVGNLRKGEENRSLSMGVIRRLLQTKKSSSSPWRLHGWPLIYVLTLRQLVVGDLPIRDVLFAVSPNRKLLLRLEDNCLTRWSCILATFCIEGNIIRHWWDKLLPAWCIIFTRRELQKAISSRCRQEAYRLFDADKR